MNSSAITNSNMPTVSVPGATASESKGSGFGDLMASLTDNWSERNSQVRYDAAKSAQSKWDDTRTDYKDTRGVSDDRGTEYSASNDRRDEESYRADRDDHDDHENIDGSKSEDNHDIAARNTDDKTADAETQRADQGTEEDASQTHAEGDDSDASDSNDRQKAGSEQDGTDSDGNTANDVGAVDPNQPVQPVQAVPLPGTPEAIALANAKGAGAQATSNNVNAAAQVADPAKAAGGSAADDLMNSTALSQPVASSSAKIAMNGADAQSDGISSDKFLSRIVETMTGDGKSDSVSNAPTNQTVNANGSQQAGTGTANPAQTAQAAQQAMAAAAGAQNMQNNPNAAQATAANGSVTATGGTEATAQVANGQPGSTNSLHQTNTGGQTAQTARQAPGQQVQQQVAVSIKNAASDGVDKISVQLRPEHLGRVDVKMEIGHDGRIQGVIQADTRETLDMLRQDSRALQQALKDAGLNADSQSFTFEHRDQGGQSQEGKGQSRMTADQGSSPDDGDILSGAELAEHVGIGYGINPNGLVDIRI